MDLLIATPLPLFLLLLALTLLAFLTRRNNRLRRGRLLLLLLTAWLWLTTTPVVAHALLLRLEAAHPLQVADVTSVQSPVIVVLSGGEVFDTAKPDDLQLSLATMRRTVAGVLLHKQIGGDLMLLGSAKRETVPISARMASLATLMGVDPAVVQVLPDSHSTRENLASLPRERLQGRTVFLVTSASHMPRAVQVAQAQGIAVVPVPCDYRAKRELGWRAWLPDDDALPLLQLALHEYIGMIYYRWRGWIT